MAVWQFIEGDTFTDGYLKNLREYYVLQSLKALNRVKQLKKYEKYGLPGYRWTLLHEKQHWEDMMESINNIDKAINAGQEIKDE